MSTQPFTHAENIIKVDNAMLVDIFSAWAGVMSTQGLLGLKETNALRLSLNELQCYETQGEYPTLLQLLEKDLDFLNIISGHFGDINLCQNLFRVTVVRAIRQTLDALASNAKILLPRISLLFNRPLIQYVDNDCEKVTLFSTVLLDYIETIEQAASQIACCHDRLARLIGSDDSDSKSLDEAFAEAVGFNHVEQPSVFLGHDTLTLLDYTSALLRYLRTTRELIDILRHNQTAQQATSRMRLLLDNTELHVDAIVKMSSPTNRDPESFEGRRIALLSCMHTVNDSLNSLCQQLNELIRAHAIHTEFQPTDMPKQIYRQVVLRLNRAGLSSKEATKAVDSLTTYCKRNNLHPSALILGELRKIHTFFNQEILDYLQSTDRDFSLQNHLSHEKHRNVDRVSRLSKAFSGLC